MMRAMHRHIAIDEDFQEWWARVAVEVCHDRSLARGHRMMIRSQPWQLMRLWPVEWKMTRAMLRLSAEYLELLVSVRCMACTHSRMHAHTHTHMHIWYTHIHTGTNVRTHTHTRTHTRTHAHAHTHTHTHTHTQTHTLRKLLIYYIERRDTRALERMKSRFANVLTPFAPSSRFTAWCSEIGSLWSLDAPELDTCISDVREPISLHQAVDAGIRIYIIIQGSPQEFLPAGKKKQAKPANEWGVRGTSPGKILDFCTQYMHFLVFLDSVWLKKSDMFELFLEYFHAIPCRKI